MLAVCVRAQNRKAQTLRNLYWGYTQETFPSLWSQTFENNDVTYTIITIIMSVKAAHHLTWSLSSNEKKMESDVVQQLALVRLCSQIKTLKLKYPGTRAAILPSWCHLKSESGRQICSIKFPSIHPAAQSQLSIMTSPPIYTGSNN